MPLFKFQRPVPPVHIPFESTLPSVQPLWAIIQAINKVIIHPQKLDACLPQTWYLVAKHNYLEYSKGSRPCPHLNTTFWSLLSQTLSLANRGILLQIKPLYSYSLLQVKMKSGVASRISQLLSQGKCSQRTFHPNCPSRVSWPLENGALSLHSMNSLNI
ncbi:hypothetical protein PROFUN_12874 [Planoprotostelium fungivorum]|uniref:Uncharacterized protein n=1 Tax=Planoprotostelium fungivorum TaxID=1890364 RepID=A0A2P6N6B7_9EUKA|nr:hypothetical protein PROFUN_12874 [Planoprotostelium fungivorum]